MEHDIMDIFIRGIPIQSTAKDLEHYLKEPLQRLGIETYHCNKMKGKGCALLTLPHANEVTLFLAQHGTPQFPQQGRALLQLIFQGRAMHCHLSKYPSDEFILRSLRYTESQKSFSKPLSVVPATYQHNPNDKGKSARQYPISSLASGSLEFSGQDPVFVPYFQDFRRGDISFGQKALAITFSSSAANEADRILVPYYSIVFIGTGTYSDPTLILSLRWAPRFYRSTTPDLSQLLALMTVTSPANPPRRQQIRYSRLPSISNTHTSIVGGYYVYRVRLDDRFDISKVFQMLQRDPSPPPNIHWAPRNLAPSASQSWQLGYFNSQLTDPLLYGNLAFAVRFQVQRLVQNGYIPPMQVVALLPKIASIARSYSTEATAEALRTLARELPFLEPHTSPDELSRETLETNIAEYAATYIRAGSIYELKERYPHIVLIYRAEVTPSGTYLQGPSQDVANRVLRKYSDYLDHFMRVEFMDDDGQQIRYEKNVSLESIFHGRFNDVLTKGINVVGRNYQFLGFSHSSLRDQSAWFEAPFWDEPTTELMLPQVLIGRLGEFGHFRSPAKCAARIGQAFSDTTSSIHIGQRGYERLQDIEREEFVYENGHVQCLVRNFSDGVGTLSWSLLRRIWREHKLSRTLKPTLLQIRFAGAKGMISLDSRLKGEVLNLRNSMIKFESREDWDLEICGEATRPLPMFLNRPLIKVLEDLGVEADAMVEIQDQRIDELRTLMKHPINAEKFLIDNHIGRSSQIPLLIRMLNDIGLLYQADEFLTRFVEMAILYQLREMKYRGRIRLDKTQGVTLYGIMDETGFLNEGEIFVPIERRGEGRHILRDGRVAITRSPAMHPGDVQVVRAIDVPDDSPLNALYNCVVFSSKGTRDLPSQLSGGDLDGDQFHIIYAPELLPTQTFPAANYPRVPAATVNHAVQIQDMTNFFIQFMENDRLGQISNLHMQVADQTALGVRDPTCIELAGLASTAVDFSKTGIPANMSMLNNGRKHSKARPDFMAPGPRVKMEDRPEVDIDQEDWRNDDFLSQEDTAQIYYRSEKALGKLYRAIDEAKFLEDVRQDADRLTTALPDKPLMKALWDYVKRHTALLQWDHLRELAREIRESYEEGLISMMHEYSSIPHQPLTEIEVVTGIIFGRKEGAQNKRLREISMEMREHYSRDVEFTIRRITHAGNDSEETSEDALALATACFTIAMEQPGHTARRIGEVKSFRYIAAALCLKEVKKIQPSGLLT